VKEITSTDIFDIKHFTSTTNIHA